MRVKKSFWMLSILCVCILSFTMLSCNISKKSNIEGTVTVKVFENNLDNNTLVVGGMDNTALAKVGDRCVVSCENAKFINSNGKEIKKQDISENDLITITYDGKVEESYPSKIDDVKSIEICDQY